MDFAKLAFMPAPANTNGQPDDRPAFAVVLGVLPPYTLDDVKRAYLAKVKAVHPDHGGDRADFDRVQAAFEQANEYLAFRGDRRQWIAARMEEYIAVESLSSRLRDLGASVETTMHDWVKRSFGEFAGLTETIVAVRAERAASVADLVDTLTRERGLLSGLKRLALPDCGVTDALAMQLRVHIQLTHLDLSNNPVTARVALALAEWLPHLQEFNLTGVPLGWWPRIKLHRRLFQTPTPQRIPRACAPRGVRFVAGGQGRSRRFP
jgi:hypothetical protein